MEYIDKKNFLINYLYFLNLSTMEIKNNKIGVIVNDFTLILAEIFSLYTMISKSIIAIY